ncbi:group II intron reverse transcriptase/maturase [Sutcliffiella horikoshii]|nr:group II intron reverse transcriptase/maturase [Sutcliffiella horikoshii]
MNENNLKQCHHELPSKKAPGINATTKEEYELDLDRNISNLVKRMKSMSYRPTPVRRTYIGKPGTTKKRPLGIPEHEDKIVQRAISKILNAIYEQDFLDSSFGFRPKRNCHDAIKILNHYIDKKHVNFIVDADIKGFFDNVNHRWMMEFLKERITDPNLLRIIARFLKGGYMEEGRLFPTEIGTPQGGIISPILANVYLHYVLDLWFEKVVRKKCKGQAYIVRYADDFVCCFQVKEDAEHFYHSLVKRLRKFNLEVAEDKTKIIPFGKYAERNLKTTLFKKPPTFDFLGFTHYGSRGKTGEYLTKVKSSSKKMRAKLKECKEWLKANRNKDIHEVKKRLDRSLVGYYNYYCLTYNVRYVDNFLDKIKKLFFKWMNRRSQKKSFNWDKYNLFLKRFPFRKPKLKHSIFELKKEISYIL